MVDEDDAVDRIVAQGLKNWTAGHRPPEKGRAALLFRAAVTPTAGWPLPGGWNEKYLESAREHGSDVDRSSEGFYPSWLWVVHLTLAPMRNVI